MATRHLLDVEGAVVCGATPHDDGANTSSDHTLVTCEECKQSLGSSSKMTLSRAKFRRSALDSDAYLVFIDGDDYALGSIHKKVEHYNLIRPVTTTSWFVREVAGRPNGVDPKRPFNTRRAAAQALLRARKWEKVPPIPGGNTDVWKCLSDCCGALCREPGRERHDDAFHAEEVKV